MGIEVLIVHNLLSGYFQVDIMMPTENIVRISEIQCPTVDCPNKS